MIGKYWQLNEPTTVRVVRCLECLASTTGQGFLDLVVSRTPDDKRPDWRLEIGDWRPLTRSQHHPHHFKCSKTPSPKKTTSRRKVKAATVEISWPIWSPRNYSTLPLAHVDDMMTTTTPCIVRFFISMLQSRSSQSLNTHHSRGTMNRSLRPNFNVRRQSFSIGWERWGLNRIESSTGRSVDMWRSLSRRQKLLIACIK